MFHDLAVAVLGRVFQRATLRKFAADYRTCSLPWWLSCPDPATFDSCGFLKFPTTPPRAAQHRWRPRAFSRGQLRRIRTLLARRRHSRQVFLFRRRTFTVLTLLIESLGVNAVDVEVAVQLREATDLLTELAFTLPA